VKERKKIISNLVYDIKMIFLGDKYNRLSYLDTVEALSICIADCVKWHRKQHGYRKIKPNES